ncbi:Rieske (2Fe-2S) protein [Thalassolituus sp. ST750PaO-4]|jgi:nitrite reductase/ring-hydroxylating ferredoxin subunit|uniref:Rieske (2Fe-2S) protein n=1 Tax=Thalassolituus sp. ST750PaO-4 TaxID=2742965 RepID=UPI001CE247FE|nr:Rieske (2Fe-2S) protein [Thalassolituus sp. ST750PaO-4]MCA6060167.1 Rieske (2Fe-2S) protein [Thalassolituus sp. ST750PaO-4]
MRALCHTDTIAEGQSKGFELEGQSVFVVHKQGQFFVYHNQCPHLGINLEWLPDQFLDSDGCLIQCAMHGALFLIEDGQCIAGPCQGQRLRAVAHEIRDGRIWVDL